MSKTPDAAGSAPAKPAAAAAAANTPPLATVELHASMPDKAGTTLVMACALPFGKMRPHVVLWGDRCFRMSGPQRADGVHVYVEAFAIRVPTA